MKDKDERLIPTPEEIEAGELTRRRAAKDAKEFVVEKTEKRGFSLSRGRNVGRRRKYVKVKRRSGSQADGERVDSATSAPDEQESAVENRPSSPSVAEKEPQEEPARDGHRQPPASDGSRVESVVLPPRRPRPAGPTYGAYSKEAQFMIKAAAQGHRMGGLVQIPNSDSFEAQCLNCGANGEIVVEYEENFANVSNHHFRGRAINRRCEA